VAGRSRAELTVVGYRLGATAARLLPVRAFGTVCRLVGLGSRALAPDARTMVARHQRRLDPGLEGRALRRRVDDVFAGYTHYWIESLRLPTLSVDRVRRGLVVEGWEHVTSGLAAGRGVILALPHLGGWEWAGRWLADRGVPVTAVAERLDPPELFEWMTRLRADLGIRVLALGPEATTGVAAALRRNEVVCLLCDRDVGGTGIEVDFLGETTTLPAGPAALALRTGAVLLPTAVHHTDAREAHLGRVLPPLDTERSTLGLRADVARVTQALADRLAELVRASPEQWHLLQPNWPSDR
jgi:KDO2-lipid IV(A) lauroyltransferase